jgi:hypothetical protein
MTLNKAKTHLLQGLICDEKALYGVGVIPDTDYNNICDEVATWEAAYDASNLYGTAEDNTTFQFAGIGQFPAPPKR